MDVALAFELKLPKGATARRESGSTVWLVYVTVWMVDVDDDVIELTLEVVVASVVVDVAKDVDVVEVVSVAVRVTGAGCVGK
jgi:hypothetical protein